MKQFKCADMQYDCGEVLSARTEERLTDLVAVHLRDRHGVPAVTQDMAARIRNLFTNRSTRDAALVVDRIFATYRCSGEPECTWRYIAEAETILNGGVQAHERELRAA